MTDERNLGIHSDQSADRLDGDFELSDPLPDVPAAETLQTDTRTLKTPKGLGTRVLNRLFESYF